MRKKVVSLILYSPALIAALLWLIFTNHTNTFTDLPTTSRTIGILAALTGASLFAWNFILASRLRFLEELFLGLNKVYTYHHKVGGIAFILLLWHPMLLSMQYLPFGIKAVAQFLLPPITTDWPVWLGISALDVTIFALVITFFVKTKYHLWKLSHQFLGLSLLLASLHILFIPSVSDENLPLKIFLYTLFAAAGIIFFTRNLFGKYFVKRYEYSVDHIDNKGPGFREIFLKPTHDHMLHHPGQFMFIKIYGERIKKEYHPFSITSPKNSEYLSFSPKELGDFTKQLANLKPGDKALVEGPYGKFEFDVYNNNKQIWIAGGIGITPFLAGIRTLTTDHSYNIYFYYSAKNPAEAVYLPELQELQKTIPNITLIPFFQETDGFLTMKIIAEKTPDFKERDIFLCGPPPMMKAMKKQAFELGVTADKVHSEEFALYEGR